MLDARAGLLFMTSSDMGDAVSLATYRQEKERAYP
jgi:hypothetical protein